MKAQLLKKRLIKISVIAAIAVSVSGAAAFAVYSWSSGLQQEASTAKNNLNRALGDVSSRELKNKEAQEYLELYLKITGESEQAKISDLNRDKAQSWLKQVAAQNSITNLVGEVEPLEPIVNEAFKKKTFQGITSQVSLEFAAMTDEQIYRFLDAILGQFPGYIKVTRFELTRVSNISDDIFLTASKGTFPELVKGLLEFNWIGVREILPDEISETEAAAPATRNRRR
jgi:hypothetical protein